MSHSDWFTHLLISGPYDLLWLHLPRQLGYVSCFYPPGWIRAESFNPQSFPTASGKKRKTRAWKSQAEKDERIWRQELFTLGMKLPPGWPKAEQFTLFCKMHNDLGSALRSKHFKGAWGGPYLYFYKVFGLLCCFRLYPHCLYGANLKWGSVLWRYLSYVEEVHLIEVVYPQQCICQTILPACCDPLSCAKPCFKLSLAHAPDCLCTKGVCCNPDFSVATRWYSRT